MILDFVPFAVGFILAEAVLVLRRLCFCNRKDAHGCCYWALFFVSMLGSFLGGWSFWMLTGVPVDRCVNFDQILVVLGLLSAAVIAGFFTFTYTAARPTETSWPPTFISMLFTALFYVIFAAISFYIGKSIQTHAVTGVRLTFSFIMTLLLLTNALFDFWDYQYVKP